MPLFSIFRQKEKFRESGGKCFIWGKPAKFLNVEYTDPTGKTKWHWSNCTALEDSADINTEVFSPMLKLSKCLFMDTKTIFYSKTNSLKIKWLSSIVETPLGEQRQNDWLTLLRIKNLIIVILSGKEHAIYTLIRN